MTEAELAESIAAELAASKLIRAGDQAELSRELAKGEVDSSEWARLLVADLPVDSDSDSGKEGGAE